MNCTAMVYEEKKVNFSVVIALMAAIRCLEYELSAFRNSLNSHRGNFLWHRCEVRLLEVEKYEDILPEDIVDLIRMYLRCSITTR